MENDNHFGFMLNVIRKNKKIISMIALYWFVLFSWFLIRSDRFYFEDEFYLIVLPPIGLLFARLLYRWNK